MPDRETGDLPIGTRTESFDELPTDPCAPDGGQDTLLVALGDTIPSIP
jgi:hypothetical protein